MKCAIVRDLILLIAGFIIMMFGFSIVYQPDLQKVMNYDNLKSKDYFGFEYIIDLDRFDLVKGVLYIMLYSRLLFCFFYGFIFCFILLEMGVSKKEEFLKYWFEKDVNEV